MMMMMVVTNIQFDCPLIISLLQTNNKQLPLTQEGAREDEDLKKMRKKLQSSSNDRRRLVGMLRK